MFSERLLLPLATARHQGLHQIRVEHLQSEAQNVQGQQALREVEVGFDAPGAQEGPLLVLGQLGEALLEVDLDVPQQILVDVVVPILEG